MDKPTLLWVGKYLPYLHTLPRYLRRRVLVNTNDVIFTGPTSNLTSFSFADFFHFVFPRNPRLQPSWHHVQRSRDSLVNSGQVHIFTYYNRPDFFF